MIHSANYGLYRGIAVVCDGCLVHIISALDGTGKETSQRASNSARGVWHRVWFYNWDDQGVVPSPSFAQTGTGQGEGEENLSEQLNLKSRIYNLKKITLDIWGAALL